MGMPIPHTGIDYPFIKRRPLFIKEAPGFEPTTGHLARGGLGNRLINSKMPYLSTATKITELLPRLVYDCTFGVNHANAIPLLND